MHSNGGRLWGFRVASRPEVGGGHIARCLTLANALADLGERAVFVLDDNAGGWRRHVLEQGHQCLLTPDMPAESTPGCVLDSYDFDPETLRAWRERASVMVAIVDHQPRPSWADLTIAPSQAESSNPTILSGLTYALVDPRFVPATARPVSQTVRNVLVSFGMRDSRNATCLVLDALAVLPGRVKDAFSVTVAIGAAALHLSKVQARVGQLPGVNCQVDADMADCYAAADFVIGGGGVGLLERMAQGLPSASVVLAGNQRGPIELCAAAGGTLNAGDFEKLDAEGLAETVSPLVDSYDRRRLMSQKARLTVDGQGAMRCAEMMRNAVDVY